MPADHTQQPDSRFVEWQEKVAGSNISSVTLLATDYMNHFNEITMLLEMIPDMPDMFEECLAWQPKSYQQHFLESGFSDKELAVTAYDHVPQRYRQPFEQTIGHMNNLVAKSLEQLEIHIMTQDAELMRVVVKASVGALQRLGDVAGSIIHGSEATMSQEEIDALSFTPDTPGAASRPEAQSTGGMTQEEIDALGF